VEKIIMSWISVADGHPFPIQNLPFGIFSTEAINQRRIGVAIGDYVLDLKAIRNAGLLDDLGFDSHVFTDSTLNGYMALDKSCWRSTRACITGLLSASGTDKRLRDNLTLQKESIFPSNAIDMHMPADVGDYTDFYSSKEHATNVGVMFRGIENALQPNWLHLPVGYHGRASSVVISGTEVTRPHGQLQANPADPKEGSKFGPSKQLDFELEMAFFVGGM
jgi:fumarylacetoacetase